MAFTRSAAREARRRAAYKFSLDFRELRNFSTIHSLCYRLLELERGTVVDFKKLLEFGRLHGYEFTTRSDLLESREAALRTLGDYYVALDQWRRQKLLPDLEAAFHEFPAPDPARIDGSWTLVGVLRFLERYKAWKTANGLTDFTDMLELVLEDSLSPQPEVMFADECQDNTPLQWKVIDLWAGSANRLYLAGDEDQALYDWSGAVPELYLDYPADMETVLDQSYRVPHKVHELSQKIITKNSRRKKKIYRPTSEPGEIIYAPHIAAYPFENLQGSVFVLARNRFLLDEVANTLLYRGIAFHSLRGPDPLNTGKAVAAVVLNKVSRGETVTVEQLRQMIKYVPFDPYLVRGFKRRVKALAKKNPDIEITPDDLKEYFAQPLWDKLAQGMSSFLEVLNLDKRETALLSVALQGEMGEPRFTIGTIHSVKGMEADWVVLLSDMSGRTHQSFLQDPEAERRVWYVGITRAKHGLVIIQPQRPFSFVFPRV